jgi:CMP-N,N'-diacetyllegionaminic acid synthase
VINNKSILAIIPARGGSKGLPRKNLYEFGGKPLIAWTIEAAHRSGYVDRVVLSSEDTEIIQVARSLGCDVPFVRPSALAEDDVTASRVILDALQRLRGYDYVLMLQPTSPLRSAHDIDGCIEEALKVGAKSMVSVTEARQNPGWMFTISKDGSLERAFDSKEFPVQRQNLEQYFILNGAIYFAQTTWYSEKATFIDAETKPFIMGPESSVEVDDEFDLSFAEFLWREKMQHRAHQPKPQPVLLKSLSLACSLMGLLGGNLWQILLEV